MTITTKYNIGDKLYTLNDSKIIEVTVDAFVIRKSKG